MRVKRSSKYAASGIYGYINIVVALRNTMVKLWNTKRIILHPLWFTLNYIYFVEIFTSTTSVRISIMVYSLIFAFYFAANFVFVASSGGFGLDFFSRTNTVIK